MRISSLHFILPILIFFNNAKASSTHKCQITSAGLKINQVTMPFEDYFLEVITRYGKHTAATGAALDALRYTNARPLYNNQGYSKRRTFSFSAALISLDAAIQRASKFEEQLTCFDDALVERMEYRDSDVLNRIKKVVDISLEDLRKTQVVLAEGKAMLIQTMNNAMS